MRPRRRFALAPVLLDIVAVVAPCSVASNNPDDPTPMPRRRRARLPRRRTLR